MRNEELLLFQRKKHAEQQIIPISHFLIPNSSLPLQIERCNLASAENKLVWAMPSVGIFGKAKP